MAPPPPRTLALTPLAPAPLQGRATAAYDEGSMRVADLMPSSMSMMYETERSPPPQQRQLVPLAPAPAPALTVATQAQAPAPAFASSAAAAAAYRTSTSRSPVAASSSNIYTPPRPLVPLAPAPPPPATHGVDRLYAAATTTAALADAVSAASSSADDREDNEEEEEEENDDDDDDRQGAYVAVAYNDANGDTNDTDGDAYSYAAAAPDDNGRTKRKYRILTSAERELAHRMVLQGFCKADAARVLDVNRRTLGASLKKLEKREQGGPPPRSQGRPPVLTGAALAMAHDWADARGAKSLNELKALIHSTFGKDVSLTTIRRVVLERARVKNEPTAAALARGGDVVALASVAAASQSSTSVSSYSAAGSSPQRSDGPVADSTRMYRLMHPHAVALSGLSQTVTEFDYAGIRPTGAAATTGSSGPLLAPSTSSCSFTGGMPTTVSVAASTTTASAGSPGTAAGSRSKRRYRVMTPAERDFAHRMVLKGFCKADAARVLDVNRSTLGASLKKFEKLQQGSELPRGQGRPPVLTGAALAMAHDWADARGAKSLNELKALIHSTFGKDVSLTTIRRVVLERARVKNEPTAAAMRLHPS